MTEEATAVPAPVEETAQGIDKPLYTQKDFDSILAKKEAGILKRVTEQVSAQLAKEKADAEMSELEKERRARSEAEAARESLQKENRLLSRRMDVDRVTAGKVPSLYVREAINQTADDQEIDAAAIAARAAELAKADGWNAEQPKGTEPRRVGPTHGAPRDTGSPFAGKHKEQIQHELRQLARSDPKQAKAMEAEYMKFLRDERAA